MEQRKITSNRKTTFLFMAFAKGKPSEGCVIKTRARYAGESEELKKLGKLPNGFIDKSDCGCGITTFAIENEPNNTIIAVPTIELEQNKVEQYPNERHPYKVLGVEGGVSCDDIMDYIAECEANGEYFKIMVVYDSLPKLFNVLEKAHLIIDECHKIVDWASLKSENRQWKECDRTLSHDAMSKLLDIAKEYQDSVTFVSATPLPEYLAGDEWIDNLDRTKIIWENPTFEAKPHPIYVREELDPVSWVTECLINPIVRNGIVQIRDYQCRKLLIFVNSIESIKKMCVGLKQEDCGIICSEDEKNDTKIKKLCHRVSKPYNKLPKFTFVTCTGWDGIDIHDKEAINVAISFTASNVVDVNHTLIDMDVQLQQIFGRQRDTENPSWQGGIVVYNTITEEDLEAVKANKQNIATQVKFDLKLLGEIKDADTKEALKKTMLGNNRVRSYLNPSYTQEGLEFNRQLESANKYLYERKLHNLADNRIPIEFYRDVIPLDENFEKVKNTDFDWSAVSWNYYKELTGQEVNWLDGQRDNQHYSTAKAFYDLYPEYGEPPKKAKEAENMIENHYENAFKQACWNEIEYGKIYFARELAEFFNRIAQKINIDRSYNEIKAGNVFKQVFEDRVRFELPRLSKSHKKSRYQVNKLR